MLEKLMSMFTNRRHLKINCKDCPLNAGGWDSVNCEGCPFNRRQITLKEANEKLSAAVDDFNETIALAPCKLKRLLEKVTKQ